ncbi:chromo shadow domain from Swi6 protein, partial [Blyttiomyces helicus]
YEAEETIDAEILKRDSWEDLVDSVDTLERMNGDDLYVFLSWKDGLRSTHRAPIVYQKCPQKVIQFYESHLRF